MCLRDARGELRQHAALQGEQPRLPLQIRPIAVSRQQLPLLMQDTHGELLLDAQVPGQRSSRLPLRVEPLRLSRDELPVLLQDSRGKLFVDTQVPGLIRSRVPLRFGQPRGLSRDGLSLFL